MHTAANSSDADWQHRSRVCCSIAMVSLMNISCPSCTHSAIALSEFEDDDDDDPESDPTDFTQFIDPAPIALDIASPMDLVYECFVKLGLRYICVTRGGRFAGIVCGILPPSPGGLSFYTRLLFATTLLTLSLPSTGPQENIRQVRP